MTKDTPLLICDLAKAGDVRNQLIIRSSTITVLHKGQKEDFGYGDMVNIKIGHKKLIIPLVAGGIGTSFSMLALSLGWYLYEVNLLAVFLFFFWMYYGFSGTDALIVELKRHQHIYLLRSNVKMAQEAINFLKERIWKINTATTEKMYHIASVAEWKSQASRYYYTSKNNIEEGFIHLSSEEDLRETIDKYFALEDEIVLICLNPKWLLEELKLEYVGTRKKMMPHLYGPLNKSAIFWVVEMKPKEFKKENIDAFA